MPYSKEHKQQVRLKIIESSRVLFNRHGFENVTIDQVMAFAGLTRGGFYNHFKSKEELFKEAVSGFLMGRGAQWREGAGIDVTSLDKNAAVQMVDSYLSQKHLSDLDGQCPMIALPSDVARANDDVKQSYQKLLEGMVYLYENSLSQRQAAHQQSESVIRKQALSLSALCVGGMILARTLPDSGLAKEVQQAAHEMAKSLMDN